MPQTYSNLQALALRQHTFGKREPKKFKEHKFVMGEIQKVDKKKRKKELLDALEHKSDLALRTLGYRGGGKFPDIYVNLRTERAAIRGIAPPIGLDFTHKKWETRKDIREEKKRDL